MSMYCKIYKYILEVLTRETVIFALTMFVRQQLAPLDLDELQKARYELKGA